ncbi:RNA 2',3'-cyclic phosphodiesterase [Sphingobium sp. SCG-1]|uniref:RNA 2',3'-cyclic phosphodiesterase n=1 Tax=Sphingobium sp. SCG-1 TaxID=2072936 RepID=UPI000CD691C2|nr:RNA 2',3'-cyclic phosphodiesterase [Sphingobium sp. SCG-1]AUW59203.1 RNA 2',3'-cyclic phosphodiesterase [Sphingobium sp. SCG-1]
MPRLFVALRPPAAVRQHLQEIMHGLPGARWQDDDQLHITLRFIGDVDYNRANDIAAGLGRVTAPALTLSLKGVGAFGRRGRADALWAGVTPQDAITALHKKVDRACVSVGLPPEGRAYLPHITLARFGRDAPPLDAYLARNAGLTSAAFTLSDFGLYESTLGHEGAVYHLAERYPLNG